MARYDPSTRLRELMSSATSLAHGKASAWLPVIELLKSYFEITDEDYDSGRSGKVEAKARALDPVLAETLLNILSLLGIAGGVRHQLSASSSERASSNRWW